MLIILAGITLNAVIGENGIIFQAKDTKNLVDNETKYDNEQLASLQNELKDNQLYSGIGIIPGTDHSGSSEGGENGTSNNQGNTSTEEPIVGQDAIPPTISVLNGTLLAEGIYQSDITVQIGNEDKTQRIKYILTSNVEEMNKELYPSGLVRELDIENGGTLTFTKDGEYTIIAYSYDRKGNKSQPAILRVKRIVTELGVPNPPSFRASGTMGEKDYYSSDITVRVEAEVSIVTEKITYVVTGQAKTAGKIGEKEVTAGQNIPAEEIEIGNEESFNITADGIWTIRGYVYDKTGKKSEASAAFIVAKDTIAPVAGVPTITAGDRGEPTYYRSDVTVKIQGYDDIGLKKVSYRVTSNGTTKGSGTVGDILVGNNQNVDTGEVDIENNGTFTINADGVWNVTTYSYDKAGNKSEVSSMLSFTRDSAPPVIESFEQIEQNETDFTMKVVARDEFSGLATTGTYTFYLEDSTKPPQISNKFYYSGLTEYTSYEVDVKISDRAGNVCRYGVEYNQGTPLIVQTKRKTYYLVDKVEVGDFVGYNCGEWDVDVDYPVADKSIGGYSKGTNKGTSVYSGGMSGKYPADGWRVAKKIGLGASGTVILASAGTPFQYYKDTSSTNNGIMEQLNGFCAANFDDGKFAARARCVNGDKGQITGSNVGGDMATGNLSLTSGSGYSFVIPCKTYANQYMLPYWNGSGYSSVTSHSVGVKVIVELNAGLKTTNTKKFKFLGQDCWELIDD